MALPLTPMPTFAPYLVVHTKSDCEWCATAKAFLDQHQLFYRVAAHDDEQERRSCR
jgi:glutaredoxin